MDIPADLETKINEAISHYPVSKRSAVLPVLAFATASLRLRQRGSGDLRGEKLDLEPINVLEVVTFYPGFRQCAPGKYHIRVCRTLSCAMSGSYELMDKLCSEAGIDRSTVTHHDPIAVSKDGKYSIEFAECLASCGFGPVCLVNDEFHEKVEPEKAKGLLNQYS